jgi:hypothetical protein
MIKKIPKDHKGLYLCPPNNHGNQSNIVEEVEKNDKRICKKRGVS